MAVKSVGGLFDGWHLRHAGHADLLREAIDGLVGNDPPGTGANTADAPPAP